MKRLVFDLDGTITIDSDGSYHEKKPNEEIVQKLKEYKEQGFEIVILTARNMRTYEGNLGKINKHTLPTIIEWLNANEIPFDEVIVGKPWCGYDGFYVDDKAIRPSEFARCTYQEITEILENENRLNTGVQIK